MTGIALLGPIEVVVSGRPVALPSLKSRAVLALLALRANSPVSQSEFIARLWDTRPPLTAVAVLRNNVAIVRRGLGDPADVRIETAEGGYLLRTDPHAIDVGRFTTDVDQGRLALLAGDAERAAERLREALRIWRGPALADLGWAGYDWPERHELDQRRLIALELRIEADLHRGRHREVAAELEFLIREHPDRVEFHRQHVVAARASDRSADAAESFVRASTVLRDHHRRRPGPALRDAHRVLLSRDQTGPVTPPAPEPSISPGDPVSEPWSPTPPAPRVSSDPILAGTAQAGDGVSELRRVVILCLRLCDPADADDRHPVGWAPILSQIRRSGGHPEEPSGLVVTAYYGLYRARVDELTQAVHAATTIRTLAPPGGVAAAIMTGAVLRVDRSDSAGEVSRVVGSVVTLCREQVRKTPPGHTVLI